MLVCTILCGQNVEMQQSLTGSVQSRLDAQPSQSAGLGSIPRAGICLVSILFLAATPVQL